MITCTGHKDNGPELAVCVWRLVTCCALLVYVDRDKALHGVDGVEQTSRTCMGQHSEANVVFFIRVIHD